MGDGGAVCDSVWADFFYLDGNAKGEGGNYCVR